MADIRSGDLLERIASLDAWIEAQRDLAHKDLRQQWRQPALDRSAVESLLRRMRLLADSAQTLKVLTDSRTGIGDADTGRLFREVRARLGRIQVPQQ